MDRRGDDRESQRAGIHERNHAKQKDDDRANLTEDMQVVFSFGARLTGRNLGVVRGKRWTTRQAEARHPTFHIQLIEPLALQLLLHHSQSCAAAFLARNCSAKEFAFSSSDRSHPYSSITIAYLARR